MPLDEQSWRLTQFVIGNQEYEFNRSLCGNSIGPLAFSAIMSENFWPLILSKKVITYLDDIFMQSQAKCQMFQLLDKYQQIPLKENIQAVPDKSHLF